MIQPMHLFSSMTPRYKELIGLLFDEKQTWEVAPRELITSEKLTPLTMSLSPYETVWRPNMSTKLGVLEGLMLIAGVWNRRYIMQVVPNADAALFTPQGAYGPLLVHQLIDVIELLRHTDPESRKGTVVLPTESTSAGSSLLPCLVAATFLQRGGYLNSHFYMRSWDAVFGLPYDLIMFGLLHQAMGRAIGIETKYYMGRMSVTATSFHMYASTAPLSMNARQGDYFQLTDEWPRDVDWVIVQKYAREAIDRMLTDGTVPVEVTRV